VRLGDLIEWSGHRWVVRLIERPTRTAIVHDGERASETIPDDLDKTKPDECQVIANPANEWPFVSLAQRPKFGRLVKVSRPTLQGTVADLVRFQDWVVADATQPGSAIFFNPMLALRTGDLLLATYERGTARVQIPRDFLSTAEKMARAAAPPPEPPRLSVYDRLRRNDFADDDE
jgi:hypothetical protein